MMKTLNHKRDVKLKIVSPQIPQILKSNFLMYFPRHFLCL